MPTSAAQKRAAKAEAIQLQGIKNMKETLITIKLEKKHQEMINKNLLRKNKEDEDQLVQETERQKTSEEAQYECATRVDESEAVIRELRQKIVQEADEICGIRDEINSIEQPLNTEMYSNSSHPGFASAQETLEALKNCTVCYEVYNRDDRKPLVVPCGHISCRSCCFKFIEYKTTFKCPTCRKPTNVERKEQIQNLPVCDAVLFWL